MDLQEINQQLDHDPTAEHAVKEYIDHREKVYSEYQEAFSGIDTLTRLAINNGQILNHTRHAYGLEGVVRVRLSPTERGLATHADIEFVFHQDKVRYKDLIFRKLTDGETRGRYPRRYPDTQISFSSAFGDIDPSSDEHEIVGRTETFNTILGAAKDPNLNPTIAELLGAGDEEDETNIN